MLHTLKSFLDKVLKWVIIVLMGANVINVLWQVFTRFILRNPSSYTDELARYLLMWVGLLGASYLVGSKQHLSIDLLYQKVQGKSKVLIDLIIQTSIFLFAFFVMVIGGIRLVSITLVLEQVSAALQIQLGYVYLVVPISGLIIMFYTIVFIIENILILINKTKNENIERSGT